MWTYLGKAMLAGRSWTDNSGVRYPAQWYARTTDAEKKAVGWQWTPDPVKYDNRFYTGDGTPKDLDGLKEAAIALVKTQAGGLLASTDWYVVRKSETGAEIPSDVATYRAAVRTASGTIEAAITGAADHDAFMALYDTPEDGGNAPINDWPLPLE